MIIKSYRCDICRRNAAIHADILGIGICNRHMSNQQLTLTDHPEGRERTEQHICKQCVKEIAQYFNRTLLDVQA